MKFKVINLGCKVNTYESTYIEETFIKNNYIEACDLSQANIIIVNTCSVTNMADKKSMKLIRKVRRENKNAILVVCGCSSQNNIEEYKKCNVDILLGNKNKSKIFDYVKKYLIDKIKIVDYDENRKTCFDNMSLDNFSKHTRAFVKVQDGCDNFCSYCIIPMLRGSIRSRKYQDVIDEVKSLANNGFKEVVLVGIHTGSYFDDGKDISDLIEGISKIDDIKRIRISSIEVTELNDKFLNLLSSCNKIVDHMHIPLQAGSDSVLKNMNRKYDLQYFEEKINKIRSIRPNINITTDVIVGFPGETDDNFDNTLEFCKKISFGKIHVFPYSVRNNTKAALLPNHVDESVKKQRAYKLLRLSEILENSYYNKFINKTVNVLFEETKDDYICGFSENYIKLHVKNKDIKNNDIKKILITKIDNGICYGEETN